MVGGGGGVVRERGSWRKRGGEREILVGGISTG